MFNTLILYSPNRLSFILSPPKTIFFSLPKKFSFLSQKKTCPTSFTDVSSPFSSSFSSSPLPSPPPLASVISSTAKIPMAKETLMKLKKKHKHGICLVYMIVLSLIILELFPILFLFVRVLVLFLLVQEDGWMMDNQEQHVIPLLREMMIFSCKLVLMDWLLGFRGFEVGEGENLIIFLYFFFFLFYIFVSHTGNID